MFSREISCVSNTVRNLVSNRYTFKKQYPVFSEIDFLMWKLANLLISIDSGPSDWPLLWDKGTS